MPRNKRKNKQQRELSHNTQPTASDCASNNVTNIPESQPSSIQHSSSNIVGEDEYTKPKFSSEILPESNNSERRTTSTKVSRIPKRPDSGGSEGQKIELLVNCFALKIDTTMQIYLHDLKFEKSLENKRFRREVFKEIMKSQRFQDGRAVYDGGAAIFSVKPLAPLNEEICITHIHRDIERNLETEYKFKMQLVANISFGQFLDYMESGSTLEMPRQPLHAIESMMRTVQQDMGLVTIGKSFYFDKLLRLDCAGPYGLLEGFRLSARPQKWSVVFNIDKTQTVVYKSMKIIDFIQEMNPRMDLRQQLQPNQCKTIKKQLYLLRVNSNHYWDARTKKNYQRKRTIHGVSTRPARELTLTGNSDSPTLPKYFLEKYKIRLEYDHLPCLKLKPKENDWLPLELANLEPFQRAPDQKREVLQAVIKRAAVKPQERKRAIDSFIRTNDVSRSPFLRDWKIHLDQNMLSLCGRVIQGPRAEFGDDNGQINLENGKWSMQGRNYQYKRFFSPAEVCKKGPLKWAMIVMGRPMSERPLYTFADELRKIGSQVGILFEKNEYYEECNVNILPKEIERKLSQFKGKFDIVIFVFTRENDVNYSIVKYSGDLLHGLVTQCTQYRKISNGKGLGQYVANLLMKVNSKLGGLNWSLPKILNFQPIIKEVTMIFGIDVTHHSPTENRGIKNSLAAVVASMNSSFSKYRPFIVQQVDVRDKSKKVVEIIQDMEDIVHNLLLAFYQVNGVKPTRLIFYRDGVSEGQFEEVLSCELPAIQRACRKLPPYEEYQPGITFIVVQKRHHIRLFKKNLNPNDRQENVPPGTVVDTQIIHPQEFDFYLCSHEGIQGTSKPCHYHVLWDDNNWNSNDLQSFTYFLCHLCYRCTRSISYPAPTYYAHLAADRGRVWVGECDSEEGSLVSDQSGGDEPGAAGASHRFMQNEKLPQGSHVIDIHEDHLMKNKMFFV